MGQLEQLDFVGALGTGMSGGHQNRHHDPESDVFQSCPHKVVNGAQSTALANFRHNTASSMPKKLACVKRKAPKFSPTPQIPPPRGLSEPIPRECGASSIPG